MLRRRKPFPLTISHVSKYWRDVATTCPLLWAEINVSPPWSLNLVKLFLERSKPCPIDLTLAVPTVSFGLMSSTFVNKNADALCDVVEPHISRCRSILVKGDFERLGPLLESFLSMIETPNAPFLKRVILQATWDDMDDEDLENAPFAPLMLHGVPSLTELRLSGPMMSSCLSPLGQITSLHLSVGDGSSSFRLSYSSFVAMLSACTDNLRTLALYDDVIWGPWPSTPGLAMIDLPSLQSLQVYGTFPYVSDLLRATNAPYLEDLVIAPLVMDDLFEIWEETMNGTSSLKFPQLKTLTVSPVSAEGWNLFPMLDDLFPTVECLGIPNPDADGLTKYFAAFGDGVLLLPRLKTLALRGVDRPCMRALEKVVASRAEAGSPLEKLCWDRTSAIVCAHSEELRESVQTVEKDAWMKLRGDDPLHHPLQFVGMGLH